MNDILLKEAIINYSDGILNRNQLHLLKTVNSTNLYCKKLLELDNCHEVLVVSNEQTAGRGRMGRSFFSPHSTGIYMSLILDSEKIMLPKTLLTVAAGTAVCRVLRTLCKVDSQIKWVNDIFAEGKKVCGILAENPSDPKTNKSEFVILGIGINTSTPSNSFPKDIQAIASSVYPQNITRNQIIAQIVKELHYIYMKSDIHDLIAEYQSYSLVLGKNITFTQNNKTYNGVAKDINSEGNLIVHLPNNETITLKSGEISLGSLNFTKKV